MHTAGSITQLAVFALLVVLISHSRAVPDLLFKNKDGSDMEKFGKIILPDNGNVFAKNNVVKPLTQAVSEDVMEKFSYFGKQCKNVMVCY